MFQRSPGSVTTISPKPEVKVVSLPQPLHLEQLAHLKVSPSDEIFQRLFVNFQTRPQLHMPHESPSALQEIARILHLGSEEEADVHVGLECTDMGEGRIAHAGRRLTIMQDLTDIISAPTHHLEPPASDLSEFVRVGG